MYFIADAKRQSWIDAAARQQATEAARVAQLNERTIDGYAAAVSVLRDRLLAGQRQRPPGLPAARLPAAPGHADGRPAGSLGSAGRPAAGPAPADPAGLAATPDLVAACRADYDRLYDDAAVTTLQLLTLQHWLREATAP
jgi:hypothetical protein